MIVMPSLCKKVAGEESSILICDVYRVIHVLRAEIG